MFFFFSRLTEERALGKENKNIKRRGMGRGRAKCRRERKEHAYRMRGVASLSLSVNVVKGDRKRGTL